MIYKDNVLIDGKGVDRNVLIIDPKTNVLITRTISERTTGNFTVELPDLIDSILVLAIDYYPDEFKILTPYYVGDLVRGHIYDGRVYEVISSGYSGNLEPLWNIDGGITTSGSITLRSKPYYRPVAKFVPF